MPDKDLGYSEQAIEAACEAIDWAEGLVVTDALAVAVFDTLERAPWWEEVGEGYEFAPSEPWRSERQEEVNENRSGTGFTVEEGPWTYFRDTRWTPPLAIGDVIDTVGELERLPLKTILIDYYNDVWQKAGLNRFLCITSDGFYTTEATLESAPFTVVHLPKTEATK